MPWEERKSGKQQGRKMKCMIKKGPPWSNIISMTPPHPGTIAAELRLELFVGCVASCLIDWRVSNGRTERLRVPRRVGGLRCISRV